MLSVGMLLRVYKPLFAKAHHEEAESRKIMFNMSF